MPHAKTFRAGEEARCAQTIISPCVGRFGAETCGVFAHLVLNPG